jgi:hypothetical protein
MAREFSVLVERDAEGCYVASVPALRGCHKGLLAAILGDCEIERRRVHRVVVVG